MVIADALRHNSKGVRRLGLSNTKVGQLGLGHLLQTLLFDSNIEVIDLSGIRMSSVRLDVLGSVVACNRCLYELDLSGNAIGDDTALTLGEMIVATRSLRILDLSNNRLTNVGMITLLAAVQGSGSLLGLRLEGNPGAEDAEEALEEIDERLDTNRVVFALLCDMFDAAWKLAERAERKRSGSTSAAKRAVRRPTSTSMQMPIVTFREIRDRHLRMVQSDRFPAGVAEMTGRRPEMQDVTILCGQLGGRPRQDLFGLFDGHGGKEAAEFAARAVPEVFMRVLKHQPHNIYKVLFETFKQVGDEMFRQDMNSGTTGLVMYIAEKTRYVAWVGDSRAVLSRLGVAIDLSDDHKPQQPEEQERIRNAGGFIRRARVNGLLAVSRALGDAYIMPFVSPVPEVRRGEIDENDEFVILACDGVWDVLSSQDAVDIVRGSIKHVDKAAKRLRDEAFRRGSSDNISVIVVSFLPGGYGSNTIRPVDLVDDPDEQPEEVRSIIRSASAENLQARMRIRKKGNLGRVSDTLGVMRRSKSLHALGRSTTTETEAYTSSADSGDSDSSDDDSDDSEDDDDDDDDDEEEEDDDDDSSDESSEASTVDTTMNTTRADSTSSDTE